MESNFGALLMAVLVERIDSLGVKAGGAPYDSVNLVPLGQKKFGKIRTVLTSDASDQGAFRDHVPNLPRAIKVVNLN